MAQSQMNKCNKCGGLQGRESWFDLQEGVEISQLRCVNCGKIEQIVYDGIGWKKYQPSPLGV